jgi:anti-sigma factor RsiW
MTHPTTWKEAVIPTCRDMSELATDYLDGALPWHARLKARFHLLLCQACRRHFDQLRKTVAFLAGGRKAPLDPAVEQHVLDHIAAHSHSNDKND